MKYIKALRYIVLIFTLSLLGVLASSCESDDIQAYSVDNKNYETDGKISGYIVNDEGKQSFVSTNFRNEGSSILYLGLSRNIDGNVSGTMKYDKTVLDAYNAGNKSDYALFPESLITIDNSGNVSVASGQTKSEAIKVSYKTDSSLDENKTYVIPISISINNANLANNNASYLIFVKDITNVPDCKKSTGIEIISCMEINDTNPLNNLSFTLKNSGKPLIDIVVLFSGNINFNAETGQVYVKNNENIQHVLDNRDKYLKPLQDRGMKVLLGIMGNHDHAGIATLSEETARYFAQELKAVCDAYNLDGIYFDDEYTEPISPIPPGFVSSSRAAAARLCYETKKAMPDRLIGLFVYNNLSYFNNVDGNQPGTFVDYATNNYGGGSDLSGSFPGLQKKGMGLYSQECTGTYYYPEDYELQNIRDNGYCNMMFAMDPYRDSYPYQLDSMERMAQILFDDELVVGEIHPKDW